MDKQIKIAPEVYFTKLSSLVIEYIVTYQKTVFRHIRDNDDYVSEPKRFFYTIVHKSICSLEAANILIRNFDSKRNLHAPLFVLFRSILADIIVAEYVIFASQDDEGKVEVIHRINFDHIENIIRSCESTASTVFDWSDEEKKEKIATLKSDSTFFDSDGKPKQKALATSPSSLVRKIFAVTSNKADYKVLRRSYDLYETFSKFEHLGALSFMFTHRGYDDNKQEELWYQVYDSVSIIVSAMNNYSTLWQDISESDLKQLKELETKIQLFHPQIILKYSKDDNT